MPTLRISSASHLGDARPSFGGPLTTPEPATADLEYEHGHSESGFLEISVTTFYSNKTSKLDFYELTPSSTPLTACPQCAWNEKWLEQSLWYLYRETALHLVLIAQKHPKRHLLENRAHITLVTRHGTENDHIVHRPSVASWLLSLQDANYLCCVGTSWNLAASPASIHDMLIQPCQKYLHPVLLPWRGAQ